MRELTTIGSLRSGRRAALGVDWGVPRAMGCVDMGAATRSMGAVTMGALSAERLAAAKAMNAALLDHSYNVADRPLYRAYQIAAGLSPADGFPGEATMMSFAADMTEAGVPYADVTVYPWRATGAYDGINAPPASEWNAPIAGSGTITLPEITVTGQVPATRPGTSSTAMTPQAKALAWTLGLGAALAAIVALYFYMKKHGKRRRSRAGGRRSTALVTVRA